MSQTVYLETARKIAEILWQQQTVRLAGSPSEPAFLTVTRFTGPSWTSVALRADGRYDIYPVPEQPMDMEPTRLDYAAWSWMDRLARQLGEEEWAERVGRMADLFAIYGFDPRSGLPYIGAQAQFDVVRLGPCGMQAYAVPNFKPSADYPIERLWRHAPRQMERMSRSAFLGLVTRPETFDYNRYCYYGTDDRPGRHFMNFYSMHVAFALTGACLVHWWSTHYARTGDKELLPWIEGMIAKWRAVQQPATGLIPHWFGSDSPDDKDQFPRPYANDSDTITAKVFLEAATVLRACPGAAKLADAIFDLGRRMAIGFARFGWNEEGRFFPSWLRLADGAHDTSVIYYAFPTQQQKDEAVRVDPRCESVSVYQGDRLFHAGPWSYGAGSAFPFRLVCSAEFAKDPVILATCRHLADIILEEAADLKCPRNAMGQWTCNASALHARMLVRLARLTGENKYLDGARKLMDREIPFLLADPPVGQPAWWRHGFRNDVVEALLDLEESGVSSKE